MLPVTSLDSLEQSEMPVRASILTILLGALFVPAAAADIEAGAPSASHQLEEAVAEVHEYLHQHYASPYGSHRFEETAAALHGALHHWQRGEATEKEILALFQDTKAAWKDYRFQVTTGGLLHSGDETLASLHQEIKDSYKNLRFLLH